MKALVRQVGRAWLNQWVVSRGDDSLGKWCWRIAMVYGLLIFAVACFFWVFWGRFEALSVNTVLRGLAFALPLIVLFQVVRLALMPVLEDLRRLYGESKRRNTPKHGS